MAETTQDETPATRSIREGAQTGERRRRLLVMRSGVRHFAVYAGEVEAAGENLTPAPLPFAPPPVRGVVSRRGRILTVIDPLLLFQPAAPPTRAPVIVALRGDEQLALAVESVEHDVELYDEETDAGSHFEADDTENVSSPPLLLRRIIRHDTHDIALLDTAHLFDAAMQGVERRRRRT